jgi:quinol monooxygenase YgiN
MGITVLVASGDDGSSDGTTGGTPTVDFPASSPYVVGCGGTKLTLSGTTISSEQAWNELSSDEGATGGGVSEVFALPTFQDRANVPKAPNGFVGRGVPDVAGDADPETGYNVVVDGEETVIGGTSAVAPLWAGLFALINQSLGTNVGYVNSLLYSATEEATFHDITSGNNGAYSAGPGWDACTGLGTPNGSALLAALRGTWPVFRDTSSAARTEMAEGIVEQDVFVRLRARVGEEEAVEAALRDVLVPSRSEPGCLSFHLFRSMRDPQLFYIHSRWKDPETFQRHAVLAHTELFLKKVDALLDQPREVARTERIA